MCIKRFTLVELLTVVAVIAIIAALLLPALSRAKRSAYLATCLSNQRQLPLFGIQYADDWGGVLPHCGWSKWSPDHGHKASSTGWMRKAPHYVHTGSGTLMQERVEKNRAFICPEKHSGRVKLRIDLPGRDNDYSMNMHLGSWRKVWGHELVLPTTRLLQSDRFWFSGGRVWGSHDPGYYNGCGVTAAKPQGAEHPWMWQGRFESAFAANLNTGHPGNRNVFMFGDGHGAPMQYREWFEMGSTYRLETFAGVLDARK